MAAFHTWQAIVAKKQTECQSRIPPEWRLDQGLIDGLPKNSGGGIRLLQQDVPRRSGILTEAELEITENYNATELLQKLATAKLSSVDVVTAFSKRAAIAQQLTNCLTETFFPEAISRAQYLDAYLKREGKPLGPLHGLPTSIKDAFNVTGQQTTIGYASFLSHPPATSNSALVSILMELGAVLYVKTNIPMTMMTADSENNIFGRVLNPHNTSLTAGGSSGGEGALVAFRGSILGVGTDIAGSIRIPALCNGTYGFKPSPHRIPYGGQKPPGRVGLPNIISIAGPLSLSFADIKLFAQTIFNSNPQRYDVLALPMPWRDHSPVSSQIRIGVLAEDPHYPLHPPIGRAIDKAISRLSRTHKVVRISHPSTALANRIAFQYFFLDPDGIAASHIAASGEPPIKSLSTGQSPKFTGPIVADGTLAEKCAGLAKARLEYAEEWNKVWQTEGIDVILGPSAQNTAVPHDEFGWPPYTILWSLLEYPAVVLPFGKSDKGLDAERFEAPKESKQANYEPEVTDGAPCSIQIVANRYHDEKCLWAAEIIDQAIRVEDDRAKL